MSEKVKKSIWDETGPDRYLGDFNCNAQNLAVLKYVEHAKKHTGVLSNSNLSKIDTFISEIPSNPNVSDIYQYLDNVCGIDGVGIPIAICMLSRLRSSEFPPFDQYVLLGLFRSDVLTQDEHDVLARKKISTFSEIYVRKIVKRWREETASGRKPSDIDESWVLLGKKK